VGGDGVISRAVVAMTEQKQQRVWVMTSGEYSGYRIHAVYSTRDRAEQALHHRHFITGTVINRV